MFKSLKLLMFLIVSISLMSKECHSQTWAPITSVESFMGKIVDVPMGRILATEVGESLKSRAAGTLGYSLRDSLLFGGLVLFARQVSIDVGTPHIPQSFLPAGQQIMTFNRYYRIGFSDGSADEYGMKKMGSVQDVYDRMANDILKLMKAGLETEVPNADILGFSRIFNAMISLGLWAIIQDVAGPVPTKVKRLHVLRGYLSDINKVLARLEEISKEEGLEFSGRRYTQEDDLVLKAKQNLEVGFMKVDAVLRNEYEGLSGDELSKVEEILGAVIQSIFKLQARIAFNDESRIPLVPWIYIQKIKFQLQDGVVNPEALYLTAKLETNDVGVNRLIMLGD